MELLQRARKINGMLQKVGKSVNFNDMSGSLRDVITGNVYILSRRGKLLGFAVNNEIESDHMKEILEERRFPEKYNEELLEINETISNLGADHQLSVFPQENKELFQDGLTTIVPIIGGGDRLGTLVIGRVNDRFEEDDILLAEYGSTVVGMEILHEKTEEIEMEARSKAVVQMAISSLSYSEMEAIDHIFEELNGKEGLLVASKIADRVGITRSVIVNALRKLESAGVIESRSLGMKGTYIKALNDKFLVELENLRSD